MKIKGEDARWNDLRALVEDRAAENGERPLLTIEGHTITYGELDHRSSILAGKLAAMGIAKGDRVASFSFNCIEQAIGLFATVKLGAVWSPLNAGLVGGDLEQTLRDSGAKLLFLDPENLAKYESISASLRADLSVYVIGSEALGGFPAMSPLLEGAADFPRTAIEPGDPAVIIYTGGTTGMPKGVILSHFAWICAGLRYVEAFQATAQDRHFSTLTQFHVGGLMFALIGPMIANMQSEQARWFSVSNYWDRVRDSGATIIDLVGPMITMLCKQPRSPDDRNHKVRVSLGAVGQVPPQFPAEFEERFGIALLRQFSQTESGGILTIYNPIGSGVADSVGKTSHWAEAEVVDEYDQPVRPGEMGEICLKQNIPFTFMSGYHNNPAQSLQTLRNQKLHTGDLGYIDEDGWLFFVGRQAHWLRRRGENISAYEVEKVLADYPGIREVVIVGVPSELGEEEVKAFVIPDAETTIDPLAMVAWCEGKLARFKIPRFVECVTDFPRSATKQEIERNKLRDSDNSSAWDGEKVLGRRSSRG